MRIALLVKLVWTELQENLRAAWTTIRTHKLRSGLTMLGVVIGVTSVITVAAVINGLNSYIGNKVQEIGAKVFFVTRFPAFQWEEWPEHIRQRKYLTYADVVALREQCPMVEVATPFLTRAIFFGQPNEIRYRNQSIENVFVRGAEPEFIQIIPVAAVREGRMFTHAENEHAARVAVLGLGIANSLFEGADPVGKTVRLNGLEFLVLGVFERHQGLFGGPGIDDFVVIPYKTFNKLWPEIEEVMIAVAVDDPANLKRAEEEITSVLRRRRGVPPDADNDFEVTAPDFLSALWDELTGAIVILTFIIASIALVVGGIGVMNIMLVSVTERTAEIGVRKAVGARQRDIRRQFLIEAVTLTSLGGVLGILLGMLTSLIISRLFENLPASVSPAWVSIGFALSVGVGLFFGIYPANRAAGLDPIACLRYE
ncbi:MAG: ABC transporter permease [Acidobacteria bacterium]|nr:ABC transporter permease [Acidobacteriota bacterium]